MESKTDFISLNWLLRDKIHQTSKTVCAQQVVRVLVVNSDYNADLVLFWDIYGRKIEVKFPILGIFVQIFFCFLKLIWYCWENIVHYFVIQTKRAYAQLRRISRLTVSTSTCSFLLHRINLKFGALLKNLIPSKKTSYWVCSLFLLRTMFTVYVSEYTVTAYLESWEVSVFQIWHKNHSLTSFSIQKMLIFK